MSNKENRLASVGEDEEGWVPGDKADFVEPDLAAKLLTKWNPKADKAEDKEHTEAARRQSLAKLQGIRSKIGLWENKNATAKPEEGHSSDDEAAWHDAPEQHEHPAERTLVLEAETSQASAGASEATTAGLSEAERSSVLEAETSHASLGTSEATTAGLLLATTAECQPLYQQL
ncbi:hypothetical protein WJX72_000737 [[Myrmecia] bisecta]|uniref:Uncharacterized protein n=1 Tax=[Myrmecia] bisecta TaxID=41462 RepID=A0AAW1PX08_9CHLO